MLLYCYFTSVIPAAEYFLPVLVQTETEREMWAYATEHVAYHSPLLSTTPLLSWRKRVLANGHGVKRHRGCYMQAFSINSMCAIEVLNLTSTQRHMLPTRIDFLVTARYADPISFEVFLFVCGSRRQRNRQWQQVSRIEVVGR